MDIEGVIAVVGSCGPERIGFARRLAAQTDRAFISASSAAGSPSPADEAMILTTWTRRTRGTVVDVPEGIPVTELIGAFAEDPRRAGLLGLVCVVDAAHLLEDLHRDDYVPLRGDTVGDPTTPLTARAELTVTQLEYASTIVLINWMPLPTADLAVTMALVSHLSPRAQLRLQHEAAEHVELREPYRAGQDRAGWMCVLNEEFDPHMTDLRVSTLRYEQPRPLHPDRLRHLLDRIEAGDFGRVIRSAGFCRFATRPGIVAQWLHVGRVISLDPVAEDAELRDDEELLALGQDLAFIGIDLDRPSLTAALDAAALDDAEIAAGPTAWAGFADPFPAWRTADDRSA
ncbi:MAG: GTP-binding protein [Microbacterium sp.]|uniref:GTP-binding protein n=1 Tax=Microbacterium sp. TaxID=51671 RepID=UPI00282D5B76|nr:GTP-binding protein [Microbacterium sp.]MDR2320431.1 GTP-binding protein [Microbacterium sp.]